MKKNIYPLTIAFNILLLTANFSRAQDVRIWSTYYGGSSRDGGFTVATDHSGNVFMAGITSSANNISSGGYQNNFGGGVVDAYLVKFDSSGARKWGTYYGGPGDEMTFFGGKMCVATDVWGNVYLAGLTNSTTGIASGGFQNSILGTESGYLAKFDAAGNRIWATYYGGTLGYGYSVATDEAGNVYLAGTTGSTTDIAFNGYQNSLNGNTDAYVVKFDSSGNRIWGTYFGGPGSEDGYSVATDKSGNVYLAGFTNSSSNVASGGFQNSYGGGSYDDFLVKFDSSGAFIWSTYYGGSGDEMSLFAGDVGVTADQNGNVYLAGMTTSTSGIASSGFQNSSGGGTDAFLVKFDASGARQWGTYYGGSDEDKGYNVTVDHAGDIYLAGRTYSTNNISSGGFQSNIGGDQDAFIAKFDPDGNRLCASYYGSSGIDDCNSVAAGNYGAVYLAGGTENASGISYNGSQNSFGGAPFDGMLIRFDGCASTTETADVNEGTVSVYPTVGNGIITIEKNTIGNATLEIFDEVGRKIIVSALLAKRSQINLESYSKGIFLVKIYDGKKFYTKRVIVN